MLPFIIAVGKGHLENDARVSVILAAEDVDGNSDDTLEFL